MGRNVIGAQRSVVGRSVGFRAWFRFHMRGTSASRQTKLPRFRQNGNPSERWTLIKRPLQKLTSGLSDELGRNRDVSLAIVIHQKREDGGIEYRIPPYFGEHQTLSEELNDLNVRPSRDGR